MNIRFLAAATALCVVFALSACSDNDGSSADVTNDSNDSQVIDNENSEEVEEVDNIGDYLRGVYNVIIGDEYTYKCTLTSTNLEEEVYITRIKNGNDVYQLQETSNGKRGYLATDDKKYEFDYLTYTYAEVEESASDNIELIVKKNLPMTSTHMAADSEGCVVEEYTYTGDTYITVFDFYFDETTKDLLKYVTTYTVEGNDDIVETREITAFSSSSDDSSFGDGFMTTLTDFGGLTQEGRVELCKSLFVNNGITDQELANDNITDEYLKKISYDEMLNIVYKYKK